MICGALKWLKDLQQKQKDELEALLQEQERNSYVLKSKSFEDDKLTDFEEDLYMVIWLYGIRHTVKDFIDNERGNLRLSLHVLLFLISSKGSFICTIHQTG